MEPTFSLDSFRRLPYPFGYSYTDDLDLTYAHTYVLSLFDTYRDRRLESIREFYARVQAVVPQTQAEQQNQYQTLVYLHQFFDIIAKGADREAYRVSAAGIVQSYAEVSKELASDQNNEVLRQKREALIRAFLANLQNYAEVSEQKTTAADGSGVVRNSGGRRRKPKEVDPSVFRTAILRYMGRENAKIPESLYGQLDRHFSAYGRFTKEQVQHLPFDHRGRRVGTSEQLMRDALHATGNTGYYENTRHICANYWGWVLPDISHLEPQLIENFIATQKIFNEVKGDIRSSSLNIDILLRKHLQALNYECEADEFRSISSPSISKDYQTILEQMFTQAGLPYIPGL